MKGFKKCVKIATMMLTLTLVCLLGVTAQAASKRKSGTVYVTSNYLWGDSNWKSTKKMRMTTNTTSNIYVYYGGEGDYIDNLKVNRSGLTATVTYSSSDWTSSGDAEITLDATKAGTYKVSFNVKNAKGKVRGKKRTMTVYVTKVSGAYTKVKFGKNTVYSNKLKVKKGTYTETSTTKEKVSKSAKSGVLKVTPNSGYSITGIVVHYKDAKGKNVYKSYKNGKKISLSRQYGERSYNEDGTSTHSLTKETNVFISWKDKKMGTYVKYSITKKKKTGVKLIKREQKYEDGTIDIGYYNYYSSGDINLWTY